MLPFMPVHIGLFICHLPSTFLPSRSCSPSDSAGKAQRLDVWKRKCMFWEAKEIDAWCHVAERLQANSCRWWYNTTGSFCGAGYRESGDHTAGGQESRPRSSNQDNCRDGSAQSSSAGGRQQAARLPPATTQAHSSSSDSHLQDTNRKPEAYM